MDLRKRTAEVLERDFVKDPLGRIVNVSLIVLILLNVIAIIFESVDAVFARYERAFWYFEVFSVIAFTIEYFARVWSSIDLRKTADSSPVMGRVKYMLTPLALVDLIAILPFYLSFYITLDLRFLRCLRLLRLFKLARYSPALSALLDVIQKEAAALLAALVVLIILLVMSAVGIYMVESEIQPDAFGSIPGAMWWAIATLTTVGYGDVVPVTTAGKVLGGVIGLLGIGMIALPAAIMASGFAENIRSRKRRYNRFAKRFLKDGVLDDGERRQLERLRRELGIESKEAVQLLRAIQQETRHLAPTKCARCGAEMDKS